MKYHPVTAATVVAVILLILMIPLFPTLPKLYNHASSTTTPDAADVSRTRFLITFGDSYTKTGFQHNSTGVESQLGPSAANPIGNPEWPGSTSSGGINWVGYTVSEFNNTLILSHNFARGGATVDSKLISPPNNVAPSFVDQVGFFDESIGNSPRHAAWTAENAAVVIWFGVNDIGASFKSDGMVQLVESTVKRLFEMTQALYDHGLRHFLIIELPPINLVPQYQRQGLGDTFEKLLFAVERWNHFLHVNLALFLETNPDANATVVGVADIFFKAFIEPESLGVPSNNCTSQEGDRCLWVDALHPGKKIHKLVGARVAETAWG
ncbi:hypothetical protein FZEAL_5088 [Fusarium zealandicum]|uniref:Carbohydrate esterase family 16 protein n=1 Tax=Fusarium zealandicum TaxID=1053134 RepID=A0A8H4UL52_9HYPO|nr:hypothetical protein FZEAL_5088 [Fusarium zealandicum]